ncbi:HAD family hydrolase [Sphingobacterium psychroaquaticum]|uniref:Haloacid dehalogenase superfamily, subfamily IA, variant 3 with third motif having DD or ED/beta-phosphoglucomutase family hydrolase n=1 Tax=Sphingobacterium psychroaquaticum TaxID=561061 RepID=A0A1X7JP30_9SPHI|nr:HAD family phosphatase [Sphingobacterium psychroaquaticum]SMG29958.1 haloacid dehalogenase superfamily, subfamily IA, variant 3 with third motif having DD or ED/beta-phosphoglucomutase family hydrolase [Sphingobacterium psychroaquaticum]
MNKYAVIFDMDGVICHTNPYHAKAFEAFFDKYKIDYTEKDFEEHMYGKHNSHIMTYFFKRPIHGEELLALENEKEALFRTIYKDAVETIPYYKTFLKDLKENDFHTAVATSAPQANMDLILDQLDIRSQMESLLASENVNLHKPHPEVYLKSASNLGVDPAQCLVFEDSFSGVTAGLNAGMKVVGVLSSHTKAQLPPCSFYIDDYSQVDAEKVRQLIRS